jgi:hypothetical protein
VILFYFISFFLNHSICLPFLRFHSTSSSYFAGKKSKSRHQKTVHPIYSTHPVDPGTKNTHVERGYGVEGGQIPEPIIPPLPVNSQADKNIGCSN